MVRLQKHNDHRSLAAWKRQPDGFARSEDGSLIIFGLIIFILILTVGGMAVDFMRFETHRARLQQTLDRAVLAAASLDQPLEPTDVVMDYVERGGLGAFVDRDDITVVSSSTSRSVDVDVDMVVPSLFLNFVGISELVAPAHATAQQMASETEISLVLDVSGSMGRTASGTSRSRIAILQDAAETFVNMLMCDPADPTKTTNCTVDKGTTSVNIVPYSEQVTVGPTLLNHLNATSEHTYSHCVHFTSNDYLSTAMSDTTALQRAGHFDARSSSGTTPYNFSCRVDPSRDITAYEDDVPALQTRIRALTAGGNTSIDIGMKWGAALLNPALQPVVGEMIEDDEISGVYEDFPLAWDTPGGQKVIVLMTDGVNTSEYYLYDEYRDGPSPIFTSLHADEDDREISIYRESANNYYWPHLEYYQYYPQNRPYGEGQVPDCSNPKYLDQPWKWSSKCNWVDGPGAVAIDFADLWAKYTWKWWTNWGFPSPGSYQYWDKNNRLDDICTAAKNDGMKIFTIGFDTSSSQETILRRCASEASYYFDANGLNLEDIFALIAREVSKLRLVN